MVLACMKANVADIRGQQVARQLPTIVLSLLFDKCLELSIITSVSEFLKPGCPLLQNRPFRAPHHSLS